MSSVYRLTTALSLLTALVSSRPTLFERHLKQCGVVHKLIRPFIQRHTGKVERSHRKDNEYFYTHHKFFSFADFKKQLSAHLRCYNNFPLRRRSPKEILFDFLRFGVTYVR